MTTLAAALATLDVAFGVGFALSPARDVFVRRDKATLTCHGEQIDLGVVYDLRLWHPGAEFHWWWDQDECDGRSWITTDDEFKEPAPEAPEDATPLDGQRLIRGAVRECDGGWSLVSDGHSQPLWVPLEVEPPGRIVVGVREYLARDGHGNVGVVAERLTELREL